MSGAGADLSLTDLAGPDAHRILARLRAQEPVAWIPALEAWLVTDRATVVATLRDPETFTVDDPRFTTAQVLGPSMLSTDGDRHRRHRAPFLPPFRAQLVERRDRANAVEAARARVASFRAGGRAELRSSLAHPLALTVIASALGLDPAIGVEIGSWYRDIVAGVDALSAGHRPEPATWTAVRCLGQAMRSGIAGADPQAGADPGTEPATVLAHLADDPGDLALDEQVANLAVALFGAIETGEAMTANALLHLLSDPELTDRVHRDRALLAPLIEESLRLEPAAAVVDRYATTDRPLGPQKAPVTAGQKVILSLAAANRDPDAFDRPDHLDLDRSPLPSHLAFVAGPHACIGAHLARIETASAIEAALDLLPGLSLDPSSSTAATGLVFRKPERVVARWRIEATTPGILPESSR